MTELEVLQQIATTLEHIETMIELLLWLAGALIGIAYIRIVSLRSVI